MKIMYELYVLKNIVNFKNNYYYAGLPSANAHPGSKRPPTHPSCFVRGALHVGGAGSAHFVCALCVRILTVGGVGGWGWVGCPRGGWGHSKH